MSKLSVTKNLSLAGMEVVEEVEPEGGEGVVESWWKEEKGEGK